VKPPMLLCGPHLKLRGTPNRERAKATINATLRETLCPALKAPRASRLISGQENYGELKAAGDVAFLFTIGDLAHKRAALYEYCRIVKEAAQRRQLQQLLYQANENLTDSTISNDEIEERIETDLSALREAGANRSAMHVADIVREISPLLDRVGQATHLLLGLLICR